jgi:hypothetical protein
MTIHLLMIYIFYFIIIIVLAEDAIKSAIKDYQKKRGTRKTT